MFNAVLTVESVEEILKFDHQLKVTEQYFPVMRKVKITEECFAHYFEYISIYLPNVNM